VEVSDELIFRLGREALEKRLQEYLVWEESSHSAKEIKTAMDEAGIDPDELAEQARQHVWEKYGPDYLAQFAQYEEVHH
jgi:hypothetical protein